MSFLFVNKTLRLNNWKTRKLWVLKLQCLLFVLKRSYICYYIICMAVPWKQHMKWQYVLWMITYILLLVTPILCQGKIFVGCNSFCRCLSLVFKIGFCWLLLFHYFPFSYRLDPLKAAYLKIFLKFQDTIFVKWKDFKLFGF